jgi:hypothetical protein
MAMAIGPSSNDRLGVYERVTGLAGDGRHRRATERLLRVLSQRCGHCCGYGYRFVGRSWLWCEACEGLGRRMTPIAKQQFKRRVNEMFPGAGDEPAPKPMPS